MVVLYGYILIVYYYLLVKASWQGPCASHKIKTAVHDRENEAYFIRLSDLKVDLKEN